jgi:hypothetical protein
VSESQIVDLPVNCPVCGQGVWLHVEDWMGVSFGEQTWSHPYVACQQAKRLTMSGRLRGATANYGELMKPARQ